MPSGSVLKPELTDGRTGACLATGPNDTHKLTRAPVDEHGAIATREQRVSEMLDKDKARAKCDELSAKVRHDVNCRLADANLADVLTAVQTLPEPYSGLPCLDRFWDMFVVDGLIGNADRKNGNWGFLSRNGELVGLAPVYDNGNSFFNKRRDSTAAQRLEDERLLEQDAVGASMSCYKDQKGHRVSPMRYIADGVDSACMRACRRLLERLDWPLWTCSSTPSPKVRSA